VQGQIKAENISKSFQSGNKSVQVLKDINFEAQQGEIVSIVGASGAGKSTFLHILGAIDEPSTGRVYYEDLELTHASESDLAVFRGKKLGFVFQFHHLLAEFTALENIEMPLLLQGLSKDDRHSRAMAALKDVDLLGKDHQLPSELSGGEQQRVAVARAIVSNPRLLLADEPTGNLDSDTGQRLMELLFQLNESRKLTLIFVTHNESLASRAQRCLQLKDGIMS